MKRFEDVIAWQKARALVGGVYRMTNVSGFSRDFGSRDQIQRAAVSVMSNIAEGFERYSKPEFRQFLSVARGSVGEVGSQLYVASDLGYVDEKRFMELRDLCVEVGRLVGGLRSSIKDPT